MNKTYLIYVNNTNHLSDLTIELDAAWDNWGLTPFNEALKQYGLYCVDAYEPDYYNKYEVIDEELFSLFLLEFSEKLRIKQCND